MLSYSIEIASNGFGNKGTILIMEAMQENKSLLSLNLERNSINRESAEAIAKCIENNKRLHYLKLGN